MRLDQDASQVTGSAVREIADLAMEAETIQKFAYGGYDYTSRPLHRVNIDPKAPMALTLHSVMAVAQFVEAEELDAKKHLIHVVSPTRVDVVSLLHGPDMAHRRTLASAEYDPQGQAPFEQPVPIEHLVIALQTCFAPVEDRDALLQFLSSVKSTEELSLADDGVSQSVHARAGIAAVTAVAVQNPWTLAPYRTFPNLAQPVSPFVLRFSKGETPKAALHRVGDERWKVEAVEGIASFLRHGLNTEWRILA